MDAQTQVADERAEVWVNRYWEARHAGLEHRDAMTFAESDSDVGQLRALVRDGCAPGLIARIVI